MGIWCNLMFAEYEELVRRQRERRKDLAERRAAREAALEAARAAIRGREELVANLEEEKKNLEKLLAEWEEREVKEISGLWKAKEATKSPGYEMVYDFKWLTILIVRLHCCLVLSTFTECNVGKSLCLRCLCDCMFTGRGAQP
ncbi:hypothetical protein M758_10G078200 [Ceratodon purpureus]|nr:hypothetical protein M758_10G078200 [Ceratodon purpureus]